MTGNTSFVQFLEAQHSPFAAAACVTVVTGMTWHDALHSIGATSRPDRPSEAYGSDWIAAVADVKGMTPGTVVLLQGDGWEGVRPEVLRRLSRSGLAASVSWDVNGRVSFGYGSRGQNVSSVELPLEKDDMTHVSPSVVKAWQRERGDHRSLTEVGLAMVERTANVTIARHIETANPKRWYRITSPVLDLVVSPEELLALSYPSPEVVYAATTAVSQRRRQVAKWAAGQALVRAELSDAPQLGATMAQLHSELPFAFEPRAIQFRHLAWQGARVAANALSVDNDRTVWEEQRHWQRKYWAMEALAYLSAPDSVAAVCGAVYCVGILLDEESEEFTAFMGDAVHRLAGA